MSEILIKSRITPPVAAGDIIHRKRLSEMLRENINKSLLLICTSAGFGKTTLVNDFLNYYGLKHAWYYATQDITSFYTFLTYIVHSLKLQYNDFGNNTLQLLTALQREDPIFKNFKANINHCVGTFTNEFGDNIKDDMILVIDDLHNINEEKCGEWLKYFFDVLFDNLPANLHLIITSREVPDFNISKLKAKRRLFLLTGDDLVFDDAETAQLLQKIYYIRATSKQISELQSSIHGWVTGLHLILQAYGEEFKEFTTKHKEDFTEIFNYFAEEVFKNLDEDMREFTLNTAILENFSAEICDYLMNFDHSDKMIAALVKKNIFLEQSGTAGKTDDGAVKLYNYQELFRFFLLSKLRQLKSKEEITRNLKALSEYFRNRNEVVSAIEYGLNAEDYIDTIPMIKENYRKVFDKGHYDTLWNWVCMIPEEIINSDPKLLFMKGLLYLYYRSEPESSLEYLNMSLEKSSPKSDLSLIVDCSILKIDTSLLLGKTENLEIDLNDVLKLEITREQRAMLLYQLSRVLYRKGYDKYNEMIEILTEAIDICNDTKFYSLKTDLFSMLGNIYGDWGDYVKSIYFHEQALNIDTDIYKRFRTINHIVSLYSNLGKYSKVKDYLDECENIYKSFPSLLFRRYLLRTAEAAFFDIGDFEQSIRKLEQLNSLELKNKIQQYAGNQYMSIAETYYYFGKYDEALKNLEISLNYIEKNNVHHLLLNTYLKARIKLKMFEYEGIEKVFLEALSFHEKNRILLNAIAIRFRLADYYLRSGSNESALEQLKTCLKVLEEKQFFSFLELESLNTPALFDLAIQNNVQKQFIKTIFENMRNRLQYNWLSEDCKKRLAVELQSLTDLKLVSFGKTEIWLRGKLIEEDKWVRKKSKIILAYLLTKPDMLLNKDKIVDMFLQDVPMENADTIFHNTISNIRSAVKVEYPGYGGEGKAKKSDKIQFLPQFIIYENKNLSLNNDYYYDADCRRFDKLFDTANSASSSPQEKIEASVKAIELYKGEFMPGYYEEWCEEMRQSYLNMYQKLCENLIGLYHDNAEYQNIIKYAEKLLEVDKLHPEAYLRIIESHVKSNNINAARSKFASMLKNYDEELGEKPEKQVLDKISQILSSI